MIFLSIFITNLNLMQVHRYVILSQAKEEVAHESY